MQITQENYMLFWKIFEQVPLKRAAVRSPAFYLANYSNRTNKKSKELLEKQVWIH